MRWFECNIFSARDEHYPKRILFHATDIDFNTHDKETTRIVHSRFVELHDNLPAKEIYVYAFVCLNETKIDLNKLLVKKLDPFSFEHIFGK